MDNWKKIWNKRRIEHGDVTLLSLIRLDGFNKGAGNITLTNWLEFVNWIKDKLDIDKTDSIFEVGCGGGAFLYPFYKMDHKVAGIDYSSTLIKNIQKAIPDMDFRYCEAVKLNVSKKYDIVLSNSVFQYFDSYEYAESVINKMLSKAKKKIAILDINNIKKKNDAEKLRKSALSEEEYENKYSGLNHLFYDKNFFIDIAKQLDCTIEVFPQNIQEYGNNTFRFNVIITKN
jgi:trans-aconitate methyltransferase